MKIQQILLLLVCFNCKAQTSATLEELIARAQKGSPQYKLEQTKLEVSHYQYLAYKSNRKPQMSIYGNAPVYNKQYSGITQPDGRIEYLPIKQNIAELGFSLSQQLPFTGGEISINTNLSRFDDLQGKEYQYNGTPVFLQLSQPVFGFNGLKWDRKIEPLRLEESKRSFIQAMETIAQSITGLFFFVLDAQESIAIAETNLKNTMENYGIEQKRIALGTTNEDRILQLELQLLRSRQQLEKSKYTYQVYLLSLKAALGDNDSSDMKLIFPKDIPAMHVDLNMALKFARSYRPEFIAFERKRIEAEKNVAAAKAAKQQVDIRATFGLNRAGKDLGIIYSSPKDQQTFSIGFNVPVIDWGRRSAALNTAKATLKLTEYNNEIEEINYLQEIVTLAKNMPLLRDNIELTRNVDSLAEKRYLIANRSFQNGKTSISELNIAQNEKDNAKLEVIAALKAFWDSYYLLRRITLYDFKNNEALYKP